MNLKIKGINFIDDSFFTEVKKDITHYGIYNWVKREITGYNNKILQYDPNELSFIALFQNKSDAEQFLNWKKSQNV